MGQYVYKLNELGFNVYGVDNAKKTVDQLNTNYVDLKITNQDLHNLNFKDYTFDAYYSGGVIEHFWEGYMPILKEAYRVLKKDGVLILTFPFMNKARYKLLSFLKEIDSKPDNFYQFALDQNKVVDDLKTLGFKIKSTSARNGIKGYLEVNSKDYGIKYLILNSLYNNNNLISKILRRLISNYLSWIGYGHTIEVIAVKCKSK